MAAQYYNVITSELTPSPFSALQYISATFVTIIAEYNDLSLARPEAAEHSNVNPGTHERFQSSLAKAVLQSQNLKLIGFIRMPKTASTESEDTESFENVT